MAKVYTARASIRGEKIDEYLRSMKAAEEERAPFRQHLIALHADFHDSLVGNVNIGTPVETTLLNLASYR